jgi:REP element-mobilizing transposase RayT
MSHSYSNNYVHIVYSTANREDLIPPEMEPRLYSFVAAIAQEEGIPLIATGGMPNHSHLLVLLPPAISMSIALADHNTTLTHSLRCGLTFGIRPYGPWDAAFPERML